MKCSMSAHANEKKKPRNGGERERPEVSGPRVPLDDRTNEVQVYERLTT